MNIFVNYQKKTKRKTNVEKVGKSKSIDINAMLINISGSSFHF